MPQKNFYLNLNSFLKNIFLLTLGSIISAVSINGILIPNKFIAGGITGLSLILHYEFSNFSFVFFYIFMNIPLFAIAWKFVGKRFFIYSILGFIIFSTATKLIHIQIPLEEKILAALFAGILSGAGVGIMLKSFGSSGGTDILSVILFKKFSVRLGSTALALNAAVVFLSAVLASLETIIYTIIFIYVSSKVLNLVFMGMSQRKGVMIISDKWSKLSDTLLKEFHRGLTIVNGEGAYSHKKEKILYAVITLRDVSRVKEIISRVDPKAFVVVTDTLEVVNPYVGNQPHW